MTSPVILLQKITIFTINISRPPAHSRTVHRALPTAYPAVQASFFYLRKRSFYNLFWLLTQVKPSQAAIEFVVFCHRSELSPCVAVQHMVHCNNGVSGCANLVMTLFLMYICIIIDVKMKVTHAYHGHY